MMMRVLNTSTSLRFSPLSSKARGGVGILRWDKINVSHRPATRFGSMGAVTEETPIETVGSILPSQGETTDTFQASAIPDPVATIPVLKKGYMGVRLAYDRPEQYAFKIPPHEPVNAPPMLEEHKAMSLHSQDIAQILENHGLKFDTLHPEPIQWMLIRLGLVNGTEYTYQAIADSYGVSPATVSQGVKDVYDQMMHLFAKPIMGVDGQPKLRGGRMVMAGKGKNQRPVLKDGKPIMEGGYPALDIVPSAIHITDEMRLKAPSLFRQPVIAGPSKAKKESRRTASQTATAARLLQILSEDATSVDMGAPEDKNQDILTLLSRMKHSPSDKKASEALYALSESRLKGFYRFMATKFKAYYGKRVSFDRVKNAAYDGAMNGFATTLEYLTQNPVDTPEAYHRLLMSEARAAIELELLPLHEELSASRHILSLDQAFEGEDPGNLLTCLDNAQVHHADNLVDNAADEAQLEREPLEELRQVSLKIHDKLPPLARASFSLLSDLYPSDQPWSHQAISDLFNSTLPPTQRLYTAQRIAQEETDVLHKLGISLPTADSIGQSINMHRETLKDRLSDAIFRDEPRISPRQQAILSLRFQASLTEWSAEKVELAFNLDTRTTNTLLTQIAHTASQVFQESPTTPSQAVNLSERFLRGDLKSGRITREQLFKLFSMPHFIGGSADTDQASQKDASRKQKRLEQLLNRFYFYPDEGLVKHWFHERSRFPMAWLARAMKAYPFAGNPTQREIIKELLGINRGVEIPLSQVAKRHDVDDEDIARAVVKFTKHLIRLENNDGKILIIDPRASL